MNYIINPNWIYFINLVDGLKVFLLVFAVLLAAATLMMFVTFYYGSAEKLHYGEDDSDWKLAKAIKKPMIICFVLAIVLGIAIIFIPSKDTLIEMKIASVATYENAEITLDALKSAVDYIVEAIKEIR